MRRDTYTLPGKEPLALANRQRLTPYIHNGVTTERRHFFDTVYYDDAVEDSLINMEWLRRNPVATSFFHQHKSDYILLYVGRDAQAPLGLPIAWIDPTTDNWYVPQLAITLPSSLYRIRSYIEGLRDQRAIDQKVFNDE